MSRTKEALIWSREHWEGSPAHWETGFILLQTASKPNIQEKREPWNLTDQITVLIRQQSKPWLDSLEMLYSKMFMNHNKSSFSFVSMLPHMSQHLLSGLVCYQTVLNMLADPVWNQSPHLIKTNTVPSPLIKSSPFIHQTLHFPAVKIHLKNRTCSEVHLTLTWWQSVDLIMTHSQRSNENCGSVGAVGWRWR